MLVHATYPSDTRVRRQAEALAKAGYDVQVVCLRASAHTAEKLLPVKEIIDGVTVHRLPITRQRGSTPIYILEYSLMLVMAAIKITQLHLSRSINVLHVHNMPDILVLAGLLLKLRGVKIVLDVHDPMLELHLSSNKSKKQSIFKFLISLQEKFSYFCSDRIISVSETMRENLESKGLSSSKICIIHNFADEQCFPIEHRNNHWPRSEDEFRLLYCGTITENYRLDIAIEALAIASKHVPNLKLKIFGDADKKFYIKNLASHFQVTDQIDFSDWVPVETIREEMQHADAGISSHRSGVYGDLHLPTKIFEYFTQQLPVICSRTSTVTVYVPDNAIFYFDPEDPKDMAGQIIRMWNQPSLVLQRMKNSDKVLTKYNWQTEKKRLVRFYQQLLEYSS
jgi:glycosyltransferase involved in cell wall biosynthesis